MLKHNGSNILIVAHDVFMDIIKLSLGTYSWYVIGIYASPMYTSYLDLWLHLIDRRSVVDGPCMLIGDFNIIYPSEHKGGNFNHFREDALLNVIDKCNLVEVDIIWL